MPGAMASAVTMTVIPKIARKIDSRILVVACALFFALAMWMHAQFTTESGYSDFALPSVRRGPALLRGRCQLPVLSSQ